MCFFTELTKAAEQNKDQLEEERLKPELDFCGQS